MPVVNKNGVLLDVVSVKDIRAMAASQFAQLAKPVAIAAKFNLEHLYTCKMEDTMKSVVAKLAASKVRVGGWLYALYFG